MDLETELELEDEISREGKILLTKQEYEMLKKKAEAAEDLYDKYLRLRAEFENYKKFADRQKENYLKFGNHKILKNLLKIFDDLKRALNGHHDSPLFDGLKLILSNFSALLKDEGVLPIQAEGVLFNPDVHECMLVEQDPSVPDGVVTEVLEEGYYLNDKILRPAKVKINKTE